MKNRYFSKKGSIMAGLFGAVLLASGYTAKQKQLVFHSPENFPATVYNFSANPVTDAGFALGRKLFYDPVLSADYTISCGSCHIQSAAFSHHGHDVSHGIHDLLGTRNAPGLQNLAWYNKFMWDGGIRDLDLQPVAPITNPVEMGDTLSLILKKLNASTQYKALFRSAFGSDSITTDLLMKALSQFMVMLVSADSRYDKVMRKEGISFTSDEAKGYAIYKLKCAACHPEPLFTDQQFRSNGLPLSDYADPGRYLVSLDSSELYRFKVPSLRNLKYTFPYMHDGRFYTLDEVLDHYSAGISSTTFPDKLLRTPDGKPGIAFTPEEREALKKFLFTLNDSAFVKNPAFDEEGSQLFVK